MSHKDLLKLAVFLTIAASASTASAVSLTSSTNFGNSSFSPSTNVTMCVKADGASNYAIVSLHKNGDRQFWGGSNDSRVYYCTKSSGTSTCADPTANQGAPSNYSSL